MFLQISVAFFPSVEEIEAYQLQKALSVGLQSFRQLGNPRLFSKLPNIDAFFAISGSPALLNAHATMRPTPRLLV